MSSPTRRDILGTLPLGVAAASGSAHAGVLQQTPGEAAAALAADLRHTWDLASQSFAESVVGLREDELDPSVKGHFLALRRGVPAMDIYKDVERLPLEDQIEPPIQDLLTDLAQAIGGAMLACKDALASWVEGDGAARDPDGVQLRGVLGALRLGVRQSRTTPSRRQLVDNSFAELLDDPSPGHLRRTARRYLRRLRKAERLAKQLAEEPERSGLLISDDPQLKARVEAAAHTRGVALQEGTPLKGPPRERSQVILGIIALGLVAVFGLYVALLGACAILCVSPLVGIMIFLVGVGIIVLAIYGIRNRVRWLREDGPDEGGDSQTLQLGTEGLGPRQLHELGWAELPSEPGWVDTGIRLDEGRRYLVLAWGVIVGGRAWPADPDGDGVLAGAGAPLPGAPGRSLIGRVGSQCFFLGAEQPLPPDLSGPLELAANIAPAGGERLRGGFSAQVLEVST